MSERRPGATCRDPLRALVSGLMADEPAAAQVSTRAEVLRASPALFEARTLDRLTRVHPAVVPLIFGPAIVIFAVRALYDMSVLKSIIGVLAGYGIWTFSEYWI